MPKKHCDTCEKPRSRSPCSKDRRNKKCRDRDSCGCGNYSCGGGCGYGTLVVRGGACGTGYGVGAYGTGYGVGACGTGYGVGACGTGYGVGACGTGYGVGAYGTGYGVGACGTGYGVGAYGTGYGVGACGTGYGLGACGTGYGLGACGTGYGGAWGTGYGRGVVCVCNGRGCEICVVGYRGGAYRSGCNRNNFWLGCEGYNFNSYFNNYWGARNWEVDTCYTGFPGYRTNWDWCSTRGFYLL